MTDPDGLQAAEAHRLPAYASFGEHRFPIEAIVKWRIDGGWHLSTLLYRGSDGLVNVHPLSTESFGDDRTAEPEVEWTYLAERLHEGRGGNGYTYEVEGFEVADMADIDPIVTARAAEIVAATHGPMGEDAGTMIVNQSGSTPVTVIPFVALTDDVGDRFLIVTDHLAGFEPCEVRTEGGEPVEPVTFESVVNWQRSGARSWPVRSQAPYLVSWRNQTVRFVLNGDGGWADLRPWSPAATVVDDTMPGDPSQVSHRREDEVPAPSRFRIERVPAPRSPAAGSTQGLPDDATGEQYEWGYPIPWMFRALASPLTNERMPAAPQRGDDTYAATGYWASLLHLLCYSFGWARPDRGLHWWFEAGKPTEDDPRLQLLSELWDADGQLNWFAAQLSSMTTAMNTFPLATLAEVTGYRDTRAGDSFGRAWIESQRSAAAASGIPSPISDSSADPLHLSYHCSGPLQEPVGKPVLLRSDNDRRQAVLRLDSMVGWYRALVEQGATLPELPGRSWHVDVVVRPVGWLGTYRLSRSTGLWFAGRHRFHTPGA
ncbi:MAG: hypothetical protein M3011_10865 [Actinomycetota bacterium]|nr:hypothetical protein [Actinomycetota bacterium]